MRNCHFLQQASSLKNPTMDSMEEILTRVFTNPLGRPSGTLNIRVFLQATVAIMFGSRAGLRDARLQRKPYLRTIILDKGDRSDLIGEGWKDIGKLLVMACILDLAFQLIALKWIFPLETLVIAALLALIPYVAIRGIVSRIFSMKAEEPKA